MSRDHRLSRRHLLTYGAASAAALGGLASSEAEAKTSYPQVPRRVLGKTKKSIPILLIGGGAGFKGSLDARIAVGLRYGVNYVDTARSYAHGKSELHAGRTLRKLKARGKTWITSKSPNWDAKGFARDVAFSLDTLKTSFIDLYFLHALDEVDPLNDKALVKTVEGLKKQGKIRHFGFSCHGSNVAELLHAAAKRPFVDAVMFRYNFRRYGDKELNRAMDAAHKAGVGLIAMKTQGAEASFRDAWKRFEKTGKWTKHQAVLKAVWADSRISAAVSQMDDLSQLKQNVAAALDKSDLGAADREALERYARATRSLACDGCDQICGAAVDAPVRIGDTMRYLMYHEVYDRPEEARALFHALPAAARRLDQVDFAPANRACPHGVDVAAHMRRANSVLG